MSSCAAGGEVAWVALLGSSGRSHLAVPISPGCWFDLSPPHSAQICGSPVSRWGPRGVLELLGGGGRALGAVLTWHTGRFLSPLCRS